MDTAGHQITITNLNQVQCTSTALPNYWQSRMYAAININRQALESMQQ